MAELEKERIQIESPLEVANPDEIHEERHEQSFHFNDLPMEVVEIIFRYLNGKDLSSAAMQCRIWRNAANYEKCLRGPDCFYTYYSSKIGFYNIFHITKSPIKPFVAIVCINSLYKQCSYGKYDDVTDTIYQLLPANCKTIILQTTCSILNDNIYRCDFNKLDFNIVCALLPQIPNGQLSMVIIENREICTEMYREYLQIIETARQNQESSMCLMLFCNDDSIDLGNHMIDIAKSRLDNSKRVSFCACVVVRMQMKSTPELSPFYPLCVALLITGSIRTWSIVLDGSRRKLAKKKLEKFKDKVQLQKHTVAFVFFSEIYRNSLFRRHNKNIGLDVFKNLFPNVPLVGCSGSDYEFGRIWENLEDTNKYKKMFRPKYDQLILNGQSITFTILTYG